jgi:hypothetical protein
VTRGERYGIADDVSRNGLIADLRRAAEFEHGAVLEYLFAAASLKRRPGEGLDPVQLDAVREWERTLLEIAREEMAHLAAVSNLLIAVGSDPWLAVPRNVMLGPLSASSLERFIELEGGEAVAGHYGAIRATVAALDDRAVVCEPRDLVDSWRVSGEARFPRIADCASALQVVDAIVGQSEGDNDSHLERMLELRDSCGQGAPVARNVVCNPRLDGSGGVTVIDVPFTAEVARVHVEAYDAMLAVMAWYYQLAQALASERLTLRRVIRGLMTGVLRPLGEALTELPAVAEAPAARAGPVYSGVAHAPDAEVALAARLRRAGGVLERLACDRAAPERLALIAENVALAGRLVRLVEDALGPC